MRPGAAKLARAAGLATDICVQLTAGDALLRSVGAFLPEFETATDRIEQSRT